MAAKAQTSILQINFAGFRLAANTVSNDDSIKDFLQVTDVTDHLGSGRG
jgi:hypothetical protein